MDALTVRLEVYRLQAEAAVWAERARVIAKSLRTEPGARDLLQDIADLAEIQSRLIGGLSHILSVMSHATADDPAPVNRRKLDPKRVARWPGFSAF